VVYGFFAALSVGPLIRAFGERLGIGVASESALAAGLVMGVMIIPFVSSLSDDVISAVPRSLREGSLGLGATPSETIRRVVLPAALPGIVAAVLLAVSRAIGETMIVVMAAGLAANLTLNPFAAVTTVTVQIVTLLVGDQEFDSAKTLAVFARPCVCSRDAGLNVIASTSCAAIESNMTESERSDALRRRIRSRYRRAALPLSSGGDRQRRAGARDAARERCRRAGAAWLLRASGG
jgi:phosphate transport system permease protein